MKTCSVCQLVKDESAFRPKNAKCRDCYNAMRRNQYASDPDVRELNRQRNAEYSRTHQETRANAWANWYSNNRTVRSEYQREYRAKPEVKETLAERDRARYQRDAHVSARRLIQRRVAKGKMPRALDCFCMDCGDRAAEYDHYLGYTGKAREAVQPVCKPCHQARTNTREKVD